MKVTLSTKSGEEYLSIDLPGLTTTPADVISIGNNKLYRYSGARIVGKIYQEVHYVEADVREIPLHDILVWKLEITAKE